MTKRVVILGAGYGGVRSALSLDNRSKRAELEILMVNKHDYHQFMAQLHETVVGVSQNTDIRVPLGEVFDETRVKLIKDVVIRIIPADNRVILGEGSLNYDYLIIALGSEPEFFNIPGLEQHSLTLRSVNSAKLIRTHIERNFAAFKSDPAKKELLTIVVGGAGFTGIELAGELADWTPSLAAEYDVPKDQISIINIEASSSILQGYDRKLVENAYRIIKEKGVRIITETSIDLVSREGIRLSSGEEIRTGNFIWTGGIRANKVVAQSGFASAVRGRARVNRYLQAVDYSNVYIVGDNAFIVDPDTGDVLGPTAQVAIQSGHVAALNILADMRGQDPQILHPRELGRFVSLGRRVAVGKIGSSYKTTGRIAGMLKDAIRWKYLYSIGGLRMVAKKLLK